ncbi:hypothetical protein HYY75_11435 [bacterium]|nr:hypothetical protein [bacterium]
MSISSESSKIILKPLLICCYPESGIFPPLEFFFNHPYFSNLEMVISSSIEKTLKFRQWALKCPVHFPDESDSLLNRLEVFQLVIVCPLSLNSLAKFSLGIRDSAPGRIMFSAAAAGIPILLEISEVPKDDSPINPHFFKIYRRYLETVSGGTIIPFFFDSFDSSLQKIIRNRRSLNNLPSTEGKVVITRDDVLSAHSAVLPLKVPKGSIITHLALDEAKALGVSIEFD